MRERAQESGADLYGFGAAGEFCLEAFSIIAAAKKKRQDHQWERQPKENRRQP
jgi:hypothetical protein